MQLLTGSGRPVFRLGYGAMGLGGAFGKFDDDYLIRSLHQAMEQGVNLIDTARVYGRSEEIIGKALKSWSGEKPFLATKIKSAPIPGTFPVGSGFHVPVPVDIAYPPGTVTASMEESLRTLGADHVDLVQMHFYWPQWDDADYWMEELVRLKEQGKVRMIGLSLPDQRHELPISLIRTGAIDSVQTIVNVFDSCAFDSLVPICQKHDVAVIARVILDEGGLSGFLKEDTEIPPGDYRHKYFDCLPRAVYMEKIERLRAFIPEHADSLVDLAIRFVLTHPGISAALTSMQVHEQAAQNITSATKPVLTDDVFDILKIKHRWIRNFTQARRHL